MTKNYDKEIKALNEEIRLLMDSKMSVTEFIRKRLFEEYAKTGDEKIKEIAVEYFVDRLDDEPANANRHS